MGNVDLDATLVDAAKHLTTEGHSWECVAGWVAQHPLDAMVLATILDFVADPINGTDKELSKSTGIQLAMLFSRVYSKEQVAEVAKTLFDAAVLMGKKHKEDNPEDLLPRMVKSHLPATQFVSRNRLLEAPKFQACVREVLIDMGDRPAGDLTMEEICDKALKALFMHGLRKGQGKRVDPLAP